MTELNRERVNELVSQLADALLERQAMLATAESCTGGGIAEALTAIPGSSQWFDCAFVTYSNTAKTRMLAVPAELLAASGPGAVSEETALAMARGARAGSQAQLTVAVTGVAGPDGGSKEKPVGTVWIAWQWQDEVLARRFQFRGNRAAIRLATIVAALEGLLSLLQAGS